MSVEFRRECNYVSEACTLMSLYYHAEDFVKLKQTLRKKSGYNSDVDHMLGVVNKIYEEIIKEITLPADLSMYFESFREGDYMEGVGFSMLLEGICANQVPLKDMASYIKTKFHENPCPFISSILEFEMEVDEHIHERFSKELDKLTIADQQKWNIWRIYSDFDPHLDKLMEAILYLIPFIKESYQKYEHEFDDFLSYWEEACIHGEFYEKLKFATNIDVKDESKLIVCPSFMGCNSVRMLCPLESTPETVLLLGVLFRDKELVNETSFTKEELMQRLKLLSDTSKYEIMKLIKKEPLYGSQLADKLSLSTPTISHHVNGLAGAGLVSITKDSNRIYYHLNKTQIGFLLDHIKEDLFDES